MSTPDTDNSFWWGWLAVVLICLIGVSVVLGEPVEHRSPEPRPTTQGDPQATSAYRLGVVVGKATRVADAERERERAARQASREAEREEVSAQPTQTGSPGNLTPLMLCIRWHESNDIYTITNPASGASGAWQFLDSTWAAVTGLQPPAAAYDRATQDAAFLKLWANGAGASHWAATVAACGG